ncbi:MAG TPA: hypothetical protein VMR62_19975, partial [Bryobacteraceae bacterium]|nr:hypothetical protein [Bryobacteraceae bacterium]
CTRRILDLPPHRRPDGQSEGCASNGKIVACKSHMSPFLKVFGQNGDMIYNSCGGTTATNPTYCPGPDLLSVTFSTALIGTDNSVVAADDAGIARFYCSTGVPGCTVSIEYTSYSSVTALSSLSLDEPQGVIYTPAPDGMGGVKGLVTLLFQDGPVVVFDPGYLGNATYNYGYIDKDPIDYGTPCVDGGTCFYSGNNSACAVTLYDGDDNVTGGRIYDVVNQDQGIGTVPSQKEQYQGRLYALTITTSGITEEWRYDFVSHGIVGPSQASPMCSPNGYIFTDYGSALRSKNLCDATQIPDGTMCGAGVLGLIDCASPFSCTGSTTYKVVSGYPLPIGSLPTDASAHATGVPFAGQYLTANFSYDPTNSCFWLHPYAVETMSCLSTTSSSVVAAINIANLANGVTTDWNTIFTASNVPIATSPTNTSDSLAIIGASTVTAHGGYHAVLAIDTGQCSSTPCCTDWVTYGVFSCPSSWSTTPALSWYFDLSTLGGGAAAGQATIVNDAEGSPCLVVFTDNAKGTWLLSAPGEAQGGCSQ